MYIPVPYFKGVPKMGDLEMDNIFLENGYPILFTCRNKEKLYLCICRTVVEEQKWIISEISIELLQDLIENKIPIYDALKNNVGYSCIARWKKSTQHEDYIVIKSESISDNELPKRNVYLDDDGESLDYLEKVKNRIEQFSISKLDACFESNQEERLFMSQISFKTISCDSQDDFSDVDFLNFETTSNVRINNCEINYDFLISGVKENKSKNTNSGNLAA